MLPGDIGRASDAGEKELKIVSCQNPDTNTPEGRGEGVGGNKQGMLEFLAGCCSANMAAPEKLSRLGGCRVQQDGERISRTPSREEGVWDGVGQVRVRSGPEHLNHTQGFALESLCSNLSTRSSSGLRRCLL